MTQALKARGWLFTKPEDVIEAYEVPDHLALKFWRFFNSYKFGVLEHPLAFIIDPEDDKVYMVLAIKDVDGRGTNEIKIVEIKETHYCP
jgi:hypothetical protein